jgi:hypothetical protein
LRIRRKGDESNMSDFYRKTQAEVLETLGATEQGLSETDVQKKEKPVWLK